jgi:hypothetical protein
MGTGQDYLGMPEGERPAYVMGLVNGLFLSPLFGASRPRIAWLETCLEEKSGTQIAELLSQYLEQHPTEQHGQLHAASYRALLQVCPSSPANYPLRTGGVGVGKSAAKRTTEARGSPSGQIHLPQKR